MAFPPAGDALTPRYSDGVTPVQLGDQVEARVPFFVRIRGHVVYLPGVSPKRAEMEFDGLRYVGVRDDKNDLYTMLVHPDTGLLKKKVRFLARGPESEPLGEHERFFEDDPSHDA